METQGIAQQARSSLCHANKEASVGQVVSMVTGLDEEIAKHCFRLYCLNIQFFKKLKKMQNTDDYKAESKHLWIPWQTSENWSP